MYLGNYRLPRTRLDQCLKTPVSERMANAPKHCLHLKDSSFTIFINHWEVNCPTKSLY